MEGIELRGKERKICQNVLTYPESPCWAIRIWQESVTNYLNQSPIEIK